MKKILFATFVCMLASSSAAQFKLTNDSQATICCDAQEQIVVHTAIGMVQTEIIGQSFPIRSFAHQIPMLLFWYGQMLPPSTGKVRLSS